MLIKPREIRIWSFCSKISKHRRQNTFKAARERKEIICQRMIDV